MTTRFLLRGGCVLTLGAKTPNFAQADVLIDGDRVAEVGTGLRVRDAEVIDASDTIVMPGFVDTHRHARAALFRNLGDHAPDLGDRYRPEDTYGATLIGLLGAVEAGITTVVDWSDARLDDGCADAALRAHADAGVRTVFVHAGGDRDGAGPAQGLLERLRAAAGPSTTVALGTGEPGPADVSGIATDIARARELGSRIHIHASRLPKSTVSDLGGRGLLGDDVTLVHGAALDDADLDAVVAARAAISLTPSSDMAGDLGSPPIQELIDRDIRPGLGIDDERATPGDMFAQIRGVISLQHATVFDRKLAGKAGVPRLMNTRDVIRFATVDGARVAGLGGVTGSLEPGMQADVIVLRTDRPNVFPINDPIGAIVWGMDTSNVDWVFAAGRVLMRAGTLDADVRRARDLAMSARERVGAAAGLAGAVRPGGDR